MTIFTTLAYVAAISNPQPPALKIAVVDTGFKALVGEYQPSFCKEGHADFSGILSWSGTPALPVDDHGHGTNVASVIANELRDLPPNSYCIYVVKYYPCTKDPNGNCIRNSNSALAHAQSLGADVINYSSYGAGFEAKEAAIVGAILDQGATFVASAGNDGIDIDEKPVYPASLDERIVVVGYTDMFGKRSKKSNYGSQVDYYAVGENITAGGITMSGSSQATAKITGRIAKKMILERRGNK